MLPLLAQSTQPVSHESIGLIVFALIFLSRWLWDYNRNRREEEARSEPRSNPPLHERFVPKVDYDADQTLIDERLNKATESRKAMHGEIEELGNRVVALETTERHTAAALASIDLTLKTLLQRTPPRR